MIMDSGMVQICNLQNTADPGLIPQERLVPVLSALFGERTVGYNRFYQAQGVNEQVDMLIRIWRTGLAHIGMYAVLSCSETDVQYRIINVQHLLDEDGLKVTDLTLQRMDQLYEVSE